MTCLVLSALAHGRMDNLDNKQPKLADLTLEELGNIEVTSVSKKGERLGDAAASVFVITNEDIRRAGVASLQEALRLAPNLQVARTSASGYSISARGFNNPAANKLLVLIDGRSVYTPLFAGVFWDVQDVMLEDVERIEVVSGPGGTLWGTNAVNGVINIITRSAQATQGGLVAVGTGSRETSGALRYGGMLGTQGHYRVYAKYFDQEHTTTASGSSVDDAWYKGQAGFRADWEQAGDQFVAQGNIYDGAEGQPAPGSVAIAGRNIALGAIRISGVNFTTTWTHALEAGAAISLQAYYDRTKRDVAPTFNETLDIIDLQFQHSLRPLGMHAMVWGLNYRYSMDDVINSDLIAFLPARLNQTWSSLFAQDEMKLREDLRLTLGARVERNDYTGNEILPNARLAWKFSPDHLLWTALSRAVRAPSRLDHDTFIPGVPPFLLVGGPNVGSEVARVLEVGYRGQPAGKFSYSLTLSHALYDALRTTERAPGGTFVFANNREGTTDSIEMWGVYQSSRTCRLSGGLMALKERFHTKPGSTDASRANAEGRDPAYSWLLRSSHDLSERGELDVTLRHVAALSNPVVPAYTTADVRFGWRLRPDLELSVTGQNIFGSGHAEFSDPLTRSQFDRSVFLKIMHHF